MIPETFTDGIGWIGLSEGMVRIEFVTLSPNAQNADRPPEPEIRHRIIMTPQAFLRSCVVQQRFIEKLQDAGLVRGPPERIEPEKSSDNRAAVDAFLRPPRSPNFQSD
jgi:hypothetical protein